MWYGLRTLPKPAKILRNRLKSKQQKFTEYTRPTKKTFPSLTFFMQLPSPWKFLVLASPTTNSLTHFYGYTTTYYLNFVLPTNSADINIDRQTGTVFLRQPLPSACLLLYTESLRSLFHLFYRPFFLKIKFKGKGYYIYKNKRNTIAPQFGYSHRVYLYAYTSSVKFLSKTKVLLFGLSYRDIYITGHKLKLIKPINIFTGRGVRFARQIIYRKVGKVSSYR